MENASKALLIAGGVLISIIIITIAVILYVAFSNNAKEYNEIMNITQIQKFNTKFEVYLGRNDITAQEIVSVVNLAKEYDNLVQVLILGKSYNTISYTNSEIFVKGFFNIKFTCLNLDYDKATGKIVKVTFKEI